MFCKEKVKCSKTGEEVYYQQLIHLIHDVNSIELMLSESYNVIYL